jgi:LPS-assembly protein
MMIASGNIIMTKGDDVLKGRQFSIDVATGRAELDDGVLSVRKGNISFTGEKIIKVDEEHLLLHKTELTTCDLPDPSWKFGAEDLKVNLLGYAIGKNVIFYIKDTPVIYLPWMAFPVVRDRKSGLLFPRFGNSSSRGIEVNIPVYWVIASNQDLLLEVDLYSKRGVGNSLDYRYARKRGSEGNAGGFLIYDTKENLWRWQIGQNHKEIFSPDMNMRMTVNLNSDRNFLLDYGEKSGEYNRQSNDTVVNLLKTWQNYALTTSLRYSQELYTTTNQQTLQTIPEVGLAAVRQKLFSWPVYFDLDSSAANLYRDNGARGQRLLAFPRLTLVSELPGQLFASSFAGLHLRGYNSEHINNRSGVQDQDGDLLPELGVNVSTSLSRVYAINADQLKKLRHEIVPELSYSYQPERDQSRFPLYDYADRLVWQNIIYYSLTNHLGGKFQQGETTEYRDLMRVKFLQGYSLEGTRRDLLTLVDQNRPFTDLIMEADAWLHPQFKFTMDARYNVYDHQVASASPGIEFDDKHGSTAYAGYRMSRNEIEYMEARLATKILKPWTFSYTNRYSFDRGDFLETVYSVEYRHKCWSMNISLSDRPGNTSFHVNFNLAGLTGS